MNGQRSALNFILVNNLPPTLVRVSGRERFGFPPSNLHVTSPSYFHATKGTRIPTLRLKGGTIHSSGVAIATPELLPGSGNFIFLLRFPFYATLDIRRRPTTTVRRCCSRTSPTTFSAAPRNRRNVVTNRHHFEVEIFNTVLDMQIQELGNRFNEVSTTLVGNMSGLNPCNGFSKFDISKIVAFSEMYPVDFTMNERACILGELKVFYYSVKEDERFAKLDGMGHLARLTVETGKVLSFPLFYRILKLALVLPVSTATVERCFSKMKLIKTDLQNQMGDEYLNNAMVCAVERETFDEVTNENVMERFKNMKDRREEF
ncbi:hypothetical protein OSB04_025292 [Centaurea solstitialis]|uniref:HAT C-terminal dimerisation domain-containing protein n=1 Tax=Centaurea solstitialis TaxID=347529 RepID=A0AA38WB73_9ASTR|nr:hypothetical protein OSB04_025292 [Centaurea solstitialis]